MGSPCGTFGAVAICCRWVSREVTGGTFFIKIQLIMMMDWKWYVKQVCEFGRKIA